MSVSLAKFLCYSALCYGYLSYVMMYCDNSDKKYNLSSQIKNGVEGHWQGGLDRTGYGIDISCITKLLNGPPIRYDNLPTFTNLLNGPPIRYDNLPTFHQLSSLNYKFGHHEYLCRMVGHCEKVNYLLKTLIEQLQTKMIVFILIGQLFIIFINKYTTMYVGKMIVCILVNPLWT